MCFSSLQRVEDPGIQHEPHEFARYPSALTPPASALLPVHLLLEGMRHGQHGGIIELAPGQHEPDWQAVGLRTGNADRGMPSQIKGSGIAQHVPAMRHQLLDTEL